MIDYSHSYILFEFKASIPFVNDDDEDKVKDTFCLKNSYDIINNIKIILNNVVISDKIDIDKANLVNFILNNSDTNKIDYRNFKKIDSAATLTVKNNKFLINSNLAINDTSKHEFTFKFPIFLRDINEFIRKIDIINFGEFTINLTYKNPFIFKRNNSSFELLSAFLYYNEIKLDDSNNIK